MKATNEQAVAFKSLHVPGKPLWLANVHNEEVARIVAAKPSCQAIATASFSIALANQTEDAKLSLETQLAAIAPIAAVAREHNKPLTVDLQDGYGDRLDEAVAKVIELGAVGINLEDSDQATSAMIPEAAAEERIRRALAAAKRAGVPDFVVNARSDVNLREGDLDAAIRRGKAYLGAGATAVYILGHRAGPLTRADAEKIARELDGRVNLALRLPRPGQPAPELKREDLAALGVARVSIGPQLFHVPPGQVETAVAYVLGD